MDFILLRRWLLYAQAGVLLVAIGAAFWVGRMVGLNEAPAIAQEAANKKSLATVVWHGFVNYDVNGTRAADVGAVVIALPINAVGKKVSLDGWKGPGDSTAPDVLLSHVNDAGGDLATADADGKVELVVPNPGKYQLLIISAHGKRESGKTVSRQLLDEMAQYFDTPSVVIGQQQYHWAVFDVDDPPTALDYTFPPAKSE